VGASHLESKPIPRLFVQLEGIFNLLGIVLIAPFDLIAPGGCKHRQVAQTQGDCRQSKLCFALGTELSSVVVTASGAIDIETTGGGLGYLNLPVQFVALRTVGNQSVPHANSQVDYET
jgi:hypothetical protein